MRGSTCDGANGGPNTCREKNKGGPRHPFFPSNPSKLPQTKGRASDVKDHNERVGQDSREGGGGSGEDRREIELVDDERGGREDGGGPIPPDGEGEKSHHSHPDKDRPSYVVVDEGGDEREPQDSEGHIKGREVSNLHQCVLIPNNNTGSLEPNEGEQQAHADDRG